MRSIILRKLKERRSLSTSHLFSQCMKVWDLFLSYDTFCKTTEKEDKDNHLGVIRNNQRPQSTKVTEYASQCNKEGNRPASLATCEGNWEVTYW